jgi:hypothetical protein
MKRKKGKKGKIETNGPEKKKKQRFISNFNTLISKLRPLLIWY